MEQMMMSDFALGRNYQVKLLVHLVHNLKLMEFARPLLKIDDFDLPACQTVYEAILGYFTRYGRMPKLPELLSEVQIIVHNSRGDAKTVLNPAEYDSLADVLNAVAHPGPLDPEYYKDQLVDFLQYVRLTRLRTQSEGSLARGVGTKEYLQEIGRLKDLETSGCDIVLSDAIGEPQPLLTDEDSTRISTGVRALDRFLYGGLGAKELGLLVACPGVGKTNTLLNFAKGGNLAGFKGLCITLEQPMEELKRRYQVMVAHIEGHYALKKLTTWPNSELARYQHMINSSWVGALTFVDLSAIKPSVHHIEASIRKWLALAEQQGWKDKAKVVVIDWLDMIKPDRASMAKDAGDKDWTALVAITEELGRMARKYDVAIWTATQGTKEADGAQVMRMKHVAFAFHKMDFVHIAIGISPQDNNDKLLEHRMTDDTLSAFDQKHKCRRDLNYTIMKNRNNATGVFSLFQGPTLSLWSTQTESNKADAYAEQMNMSILLAESSGTV